MITRRRPCPAAPGPLEGYAARFDDLFGSLAQRRGFREYLAGLLALRDRNKTLTALAGAEPVAGAQHAAVQRLQFFLSESRWDPERVNARPLELLLADPGTLPDKATWYLATNLPRPGGPREPGSVHPAADLAEIVRIYGIRHWIEQSYKQVKDELGWADFQVRSDIAIRRHQALVNCAFSFCWAAWFADHPPQHDPAAPRPEPGRGEGGRGPPYRRRRRPGRGRCARYEPGFPRQSRCGAGGSHGRKRPRRRSCKP